MFAPFHGPDTNIWSLSVYDDVAIANKFIGDTNALEASLIAGILVAVIAPFIILANGIVLAAIWKDPYKQLRSSPSNIIIASMAFCDFLVGLVCSSVQSYAYLDTYVNHELKASSMFVSHASGMFFVGLSLAHVLVLTVDRVLAVSSPMLYKARVTKERLMKILAFTWIFYLFLACLYYLLRYHVYIYVTCNITFTGFTVLIACGLSVKIVYSVRKQSHELKVEKNLNANMRIVMERDRKTTRTVLLIIILLLLCCTPFAVVLMISLTCTKCGIPGGIALATLHNFSLVLIHVNSLINPFLYAFRLPKFKKPIKLIVTCLLRCRRIRKISPNNSLDMTIDSRITTPKIDRNRIADKPVESYCQNTRL